MCLSSAYKNLVTEPDLALGTRYPVSALNAAIRLYLRGRDWSCVLQCVLGGDKLELCSVHSPLVS